MFELAGLPLIFAFYWPRCRRTQVFPSTVANSPEKHKLQIKAPVSTRPDLEILFKEIFHRQCVVFCKKNYDRRLRQTSSAQVFIRLWSDFGFHTLLFLLSYLRHGEETKQLAQWHLLWRNSQTESAGTVGILSQPAEPPLNEDTPRKIHNEPIV